MLVSPDHLAAVVVAPFIGSFLSVLVVRLPAAAPVVWSRSQCAGCGAALGPVDLMPLLSWLWLRGRCRHCGVKLSALYPALELAAIVVALWSASVLTGALFWLGCALGWLLLALAVTDWREMILPDALNLPLVAGGLAVGAAFDGNFLADHAIGAAIGFSALYVVNLVYRQMRGRDGLGLGDAKLLAASGAWLGWAGLPSVVLIAGVTALSAVLVGRLSGRGLGAHDPVPFGTFLAAGFWLVWLYGPLTF
ncbi:MAG: prepilin peptidase [Candidatus Eiseniibacteriota bacterium]